MIIADVTDDSPGGMQHMKKWISWIICLFLLLGGVLPAQADGNPDVFIRGDFGYVLREDGTAEIINYFGEENELTLPEELDGRAVTGIGDEAFRNRKSLTAVTIPDSIVHIGVNPFVSCKNLQTLTVSPEHPALEVADGVLFSKAEKALLCCPMTKSDPEYRIPEGTRIIGAQAFDRCQALTSVIIPDSVTRIGDKAFNYCAGLTEVSIPDSVEAVGVNPFIFCESLVSVTVSPAHPVLESKEGVLFGKKDNRLISYPIAKEGSAYTVPAGTRIIGEGAFERCWDLTAVTLPDSVSAIEASAFRACSGLTAITIPDGTVSIGKSAFRECAGLTAVTIPDSVAEIGKYAFCGCVGLVEVTVPHGITVLEDGVFSYCAGLTAVTIPDSVTRIATVTFDYCAAMGSIIIPDSVTAIESNSFAHCPNLVLTVGKGSFAEAYCTQKQLFFTNP